MISDVVAPSNGLVIYYNYLWAREYGRHEESWRKARPVCVQIIAGGKSGTVVALFPITSQPPQPDEQRSKFRKWKRGASG
jgi:hypothetical protein